jgi:putative ABC transport system ATP-binding protein
VAGGPGPDRARQDHAAAHPGRPGPAQHRDRHFRRPRPGPAARGAGHQAPSGSIGFVFQTFNLVPTLSAAENVESALIPLGTSSGERRRLVAAALESVGLSDRARHLPSQLSGGQQQRVAIARALVKQPQVLLADEPTGNLDEDTRDEITALLEKLWRGLGLTLVRVTHDSAVAGRAQRVAIMNKGRLSIRQDTRPAAN